MSYVHVEAIQDMARLWGVTAYGPNRFGHLVVSESDANVLREIAFAEPRLTAILMPAPQWAGIGIETAPDWTCHPQAVALARLYATLIVATRIRDLVRWLNHKLQPQKQTPNPRNPRI